MSVTADDFESLARGQAPEDSEIQIRCSISRAYYATYHRIKELFPDVPAYRKIGVHKSLEVYLLEDMSPKPGSTNQHRSLGLKLRQIRDQRVLADYHLDENLGPEDQALALRYTNEVKNVCDNIINS